MQTFQTVTVAAGPRLAPTAAFADARRAAA
jgi:hypothetical protein